MQNDDSPQRGAMNRAERDKVNKSITGAETYLLLFNMEGRPTAHFRGSVNTMAVLVLSFAQRQPEFLAALRTHLLLDLSRDISAGKLIAAPEMDVLLRKVESLKAQMESMSKLRTKVILNGESAVDSPGGSDSKEV
uniref:Uncharacterized protein n=2 Tax=viral metagenome TaxID=1070528 RepID=A0A6M3XEY5_9ZZZZ